MRWFDDQNIMCIASARYSHAPTFQPTMAWVMGCMPSELGSNNAVPTPTASPLNKRGRARTKRTMA